MSRKPRIVITIVTPTGTSELSIVKGRLMSDGRPAPGPTEKQFKIASKAITDLVNS